MRTIRTLCLALACAICAPIYHADTVAEHKALQQIVKELKQLDKLIDKAEREANPSERIRFRYDWLRRDIKLMKDGIQDHLDGPSTEPRTFEPLQGDYRQ